MWISDGSLFLDIAVGIAWCCKISERDCLNA